MSITFMCTGKDILSGGALVSIVFDDACINQRKYLSCPLLSCVYGKDILSGGAIISIVMSIVYWKDILSDGVLVSIVFDDACINRGSICHVHCFHTYWESGGALISIVFDGACIILRKYLSCPLLSCVLGRTYYLVVHLYP